MDTDSYLECLEAERSFLRHAIIYPRDTLPDSKCKPVDFFDRRNRKLYEYVIHEFENTETDRFDKLELQRIEDVSSDHINQILSHKTLGNDPTVWDSEICRFSLERRLRNTLRILGDDEAADPAAHLEHCISVLRGLSEDAAPATSGDIKTAVHLAVDAAERAAEGGFAGVDVGFDCVRKICGGIPYGVITVLGARTSVGKTALAVTFCYHAAANVRCDYYTLEDSRERIVNRLIGIDGGVSIQGIVTGSLSDAEYQKMFSSAASVSELKMGIYDSLPSDAEQFILSVRRNCRTNKTRLVVVDYIQLLRLSGKSGNRNEEIDKIVAMFKKLAKDLDVAVLILSQMRRPGSGEPETPTKDQLRDSGTIEQHAHVILLLHRKKGKADGETELLVEKNKDGPTGSVKIWYEGKYTRYEEGKNRPEKLPVSEEDSLYDL